MSAGCVIFRKKGEYMKTHWIFKTWLFKITVVVSGMFVLTEILYVDPTWQELAQCAGAKATLMDGENTSNFIELAKIEINDNNLDVSTEDLIREMDKAFNRIMESKTPEDKQKLHNAYIDNCTP